MTGADAQSEELIAFLTSKRWFGDKTREIRDAMFRDVVPIEWPNSQRPFAVARVDVTTDAGRSTYQVFFERGAPRLTDALEEPDFRRGLADAFAGNLAFEHAGVRFRFDAGGRRSFVVPPSAVVKLSKSEQSNSSVIMGDQAILKLFRKLQPGVNPDVEITRFLTIERQFVHVPVLLGTICFEDAAGTTVAGMLQELVPSASDAWAYALEVTRGYFRSQGRAGSLPFQEEAEQLGGITRSMHESLASGTAGGDFDARPVGAADLRAWSTLATGMVRYAMRSLERALSGQLLTRDNMDVARRMAQGAESFAARVAALVDAVGADAGAKTRVHGDYHLAQIIRSAGGHFFVIDFEGEPARPLQERRAHQSPLKDVAGMLRSFSYAAAASSTRGDPRAGQWERATRESFLRGYFRQPGTDRGILPRSRENADRLIALFETEKIFYELQYELDHRPDWAWIPLSGIASLSQ